MSDNKHQNTEIITTFGERLEDLLQERNLTKEQFANKLGITRQTISEYINNPLKDLSFELVKRIATELDVSIDYLAGFKAEKTLIGSNSGNINLTKDACEAISTANYDHSILSEILSHPHFNLLMLDIMVLLSQQYALNIVQNNAVLSFSRELVLEQMGGTETFETKLMELAAVDENEFVKNTIHKDLDIILEDLGKKHKSEDIDLIKEQLRAQMTNELKAGYEESKAFNSGSSEDFIKIILGRLKIDKEQLTQEQYNSILEVVKLSPLLKSGISQRGKT